MPWTCPNTECTYDKQLQSGQDCPLCGKEAKEFKFVEFGNLLRKKEAFRKSVDRNKECERVLGRTKFCPRCGSNNVFWARGLPQLWSVWECRECSYRGSLIVEDGKLADKLRKEYILRKKKLRKGRI
jgi:hypothetical protein